MNMEKALQEAAIKGDTSQMLKILQQDPLILDRIQLGSLSHTPLHISSFRGHLPFTIETISRCPSLVLVLDNRRWSPLHLAAAQGHVEVVRALAQAGPEMCGAVDGDGYNPLHLAVVKGRTGVLRELVRVGMHAARGKTGGGDGILHLCVKYERLDCLTVLMENIGDPEFVNGKDFDGNNVLHQAVKYKQIQIINYIISNYTKVDINATNAMGLTPLDILLQQNYHMNLKDIEIRDTLKQAGAMKSNEIPYPWFRNDAYTVNNRILEPNNNSNRQESQNNNNNNNNNNADWLPRRRDSLMVVASLIASMAFSAGLNPPGGVWQDSSQPGGDNNNNNLKYIYHRAGEAIIAYNYPDSYKFYLRSNTIAYVASLSIILLLISGLPFRRRRYMWTLQVVMWVTISAMAFTYAYALVALTPEKDRKSLRKTLMVAVFVWCVVMALVFLGNAIRLCMKWVKGKGMNCWKGIHRNPMAQIQ